MATILININGKKIIKSENVIILAEYVYVDDDTPITSMGYTTRPVYTLEGARGSSEEHDELVNRVETETGEYAVWVYDTKMYQYIKETWAGEEFDDTILIALLHDENAQQLYDDVHSTYVELNIDSLLN